MKQQQITLFIPGNQPLLFVEGVKNIDYIPDGKVTHITAYGDSVDIVFESGRQLGINGIPYIYDRYGPPEETPF